MCQVVEYPFLKSGSSTLLWRVDIHIKILFKASDVLTYHDDDVIKCLHSPNNKNTEPHGCVPSAELQFSKTAFQTKSMQKGHIHQK